MCGVREWKRLCQEEHRSPRVQTVSPLLLPPPMMLSSSGAGFFFVFCFFCARKVLPLSYEGAPVT